MEIFENKTILVADDDSGNRELVVSTMSGLSRNIKVLSAAHGGQVFDVLEKRKVNVLLLDWEMPVINGFETLIKIKENEKWKNLPVLMYTGVMTATENLVKALEAGAADFIRKPAEPIELIARIKSVLTLQENFEARILAEKEISEIHRRENDGLKDELNSYLVQLSRKNEVLIELRERLNTGEKNNQLVTYIESIVNGENYWDDLFQRFSRFDKQFLDKLHKKHNDLSPAETRFCLLIKAGMTSKDIGSLMNVTAAAVEKSRYRIRKKLGLQPEDSFEKYIFSI
ncbi:MAG: two component transcriptional regulator, LuxR family protein [Bacteroidetes bacterium]|nr:MAG: two component transcriptional regulator, LuxR family protein [Bacteroidota bacterium]